MDLDPSEPRSRKNDPCYPLKLNEKMSAVDHPLDQCGIWSGIWLGIRHAMDPQMDPSALNKSIYLGPQQTNKLKHRDGGDLENC